MLFQIKNEPCIPGESVKGLYLYGWHEDPPITQHCREQLAENKPRLLEELEQHFKPEPGVIYNAALAGFQKEYAGETLEAVGFRHVMTSHNPNTGREINLYVRDPIDV